MKSDFGRNLTRLRKTKNLTQSQLADLLGVSFQAVSKWETGQSYPDIELLPLLTDLLETNMDILLGHIPGDAKKSIYHDTYLQEDYYWGLYPDELCYEVIKLMPPVRPYKLLDIGCGEGKDSLFFARNGYDVTAFDIAQSGVDKVNALADRYHVCIRAFRSDMLEYHLTEKYDIIYSSRSLHYIRPELRNEIISHYQEYTMDYGINAFNVYVDKPFIAPSPEFDSFAYLWKTGELFSYYADWEIMTIQENVYDCNSSDIPHKHANNVIVARKPRVVNNEI